MVNFPVFTHQGQVSLITETMDQSHGACVVTTVTASIVMETGLKKGFNKLYQNEGSDVFSIQIVTKM